MVDVARVDSPAAQNEVDPIVQMLAASGRTASAKAIQNRLNAGDYSCLALFTTSENEIDVPLFCLIRSLILDETEVDIIEMERLREAIAEFKKEKKVSSFTMGLIIDRIFARQLSKKLFSSIQDILRLLVLFRSNYEKIDGEMDKPHTKDSFWEEAIHLWIQNYGIATRSADDCLLPKSVVDLFRSGDLSAIKLCLEKRDGASFMEFISNLNKIQLSSHPLTNSQWRKITSCLGRQEELVGSINILAESFRVMVLSWLEGKDSTEGIQTTEQQIARNVYLLVKEANWRFDDVSILFKFSPQRKKQILSALNMLLDYSMKSEVLKKLSSDLTTEALKEMMRNITQEAFAQERSYSCEQAIQQIIETSNFDKKAEINGYDLGATFKRYKIAYEALEKKCRSIEGLKLHIQQAKGNKYLFQAKQKANENVKNNMLSLKIFGSNLERIAAAVFAVNSYFKIQMRDVQILTLILAGIARQASVPRIFQKQTGEGKTYVVAALAIYEVLCGNKVDVVTSSSELAENQCNQLKDLYNSIGLTVSHNANKKKEQTVDGHLEELANSSAECAMETNAKRQQILPTYMADVVYGSAADFMFDVLREDFGGSELRHGRGFPVAIIDEVDNMLLDGRNDSVRLASPSPGMGNLLGVKAGIWQLINIIHSQMKKQDGVWYYEDNDEITQFESDAALYSFVQSRSFEFIKKTLGLMELTAEEEGGDANWDDHVKETNSEAKLPRMPFPKIEYPIWLKTFVETQLPKWIESAVKARFFMDPNFNYILQENKIVVVDAANTGVHHPTMQWSDGLHQFLQMKHALEVEPESLPTNYLSNVAFFLRYKKNLLGLTGTIGGESSRKFLREIYSVDFVDIPPFKERRHKMLRPKICGNDWLNTVVETTVEKMKLGRAVLLINQYIHHTNEIRSAIIKHFNGDGSKVKVYTSKETNDVLNNQIQAGTCLVATNIAERGTDLSVSPDVLASGGLHVLLTALPETDRVERQNIGRTSRTGQVGTSQIILNVGHLSGDLLNALASQMTTHSTQEEILQILRSARDQRSMRTVDKALEDRKTREKADETLLAYIALRRSKVAGSCDITRRSLDARFGRYLAQTEIINKEDMEKEFQNLDSNYIDNPSLAVLYAQTKFGPFCTIGTNNYKVAMDYLTKAIEIDNNFSASAYYFRAALKLDAYSTVRDIQIVHQAVEDFKKSRECLERVKLQYQILIQATSFEKNEAKTLVLRQSEKHIIVCDTIIKNIESIIGREIKDDLEYYEQAIEEAKKEKKPSEALEKQYNELIDNRESIEGGVLGQIEKNKHEIKIVQKAMIDALPESEKKDEYWKVLDDYKNEGFSYLLVVSDRPPINWWAVAAVAGAALLQIVGGVTAFVFSVGAGAKLGLSLLQEGICDMIHIIKAGIISRNFSWKSYAIQKAISLAITFVTLGWGAIKAVKSAGKGIVKGTKSGIQILKGTGTRIAKDGWKLAVKKTAQTAFKEVSKEVLISSFDHFCGETANASVACLLKKACFQVVNDMHGEHTDLKQLVDWDNANGDNKLINLFVKKTTASLNSKPNFLIKVGKTVANVAARGIESYGGVDGASKTFEIAKNVIAVGVVADTLKKYLTSIPGVLKEIRSQYEKKPVEAVQRHEHRGYVNSTVKEALYQLSEKLAGFYAPVVVSTVSTYVIGRLCEKGLTNLWNVDTELAQFRTAWVDSKIVVEKANQLQKKVGENSMKGVTLGIIAEVAVDSPSDLIQAEQCAQAIQQKIQIILPDGSVKIYGEKFPGKAVCLHFVPGVDDEIGHYSLSDGTKIENPSGKNNCFYDAIAQKTGYDADSLRKATANFMLNNLDSVAGRYYTIDKDSLCIGGKLEGKSPFRSVGHGYRVKVVEDLYIVFERQKDERGKRIERNPKKKRKSSPEIKCYSVIDELSEEMEKNLINLENIESYKYKSKNDKIYIYIVYEERLIYHLFSNKAGELIKIEAVRGKAKIMSNGDSKEPFHYDGLIEKSERVVLWEIGEPELDKGQNPEELFNQKLNSKK